MQNKPATEQAARDGGIGRRTLVVLSIFIVGLLLLLPQSGCQQDAASIEGPIVQDQGPPVVETADETEASSRVDPETQAAGPSVPAV